MPQNSPLNDFLSYGDVIVAVDGSRIHLSGEWTEKMIQMNSQMVDKTGSGRKGYCVPKFSFRGTNNTQVTDNNPCPDELATFVTVPCHNSSLLGGISNEEINDKQRITEQCLSAKEAVKLRKCGDGWEIGTEGSKCTCLEV